MNDDSTIPGGTGPIHVLIVDDHAMVREGLSGLLLAFDDLELVGEASDGKEALRLCAEARPDVVLMDVTMPGMGGIAATRIICQNYPQVRVITLTNFEDEALMQAALRAGATGYLLKDASAEELVSAIRAANAGQRPSTPEQRPYSPSTT